MKFSIGELINQIKALIEKLTMPQKITIGLTLVAALATMVSLIIWATLSNRPGETVLFSNLSTQDAGEITAKLSEMQVPYQLIGDGTTISVPAEQVHQTRLNLAQEGLPRGSGVGFEIFDETSLGMTEFVQKVNYRRALQGELARTISSLDGIESARVHIALPERSLFIDEDQPTKASVSLQLDQYVQIKGDQVKGIIHLVASSVEGLDPVNVIVVDADGRVLNEMIKQENEDSTLTVTQLLYQKNVERKLKTQLDNLLVQVLGKGNAHSSVTVELDFDKVEEEVLQYDPENVVRSEQSITENEVGREAEGGIPGVRANVADQPEAQAPITNERSKEALTTNYEVGKITRHIVRTRGAITRISVAVAVNGRYVEQDVDGSTQQVYEPRPENEITKIEQLVQSAIGYSQERGDRVVVTNLEFGEAPKSTLLKVLEMQELWTEILKYFGIFLFFLLTFLFVVRPLVRWVTDMTRDEEEVSKTFGQGTKRPGSLVPTKLPKTLAEIESELETEIDSENQASVDSVRGKVIRKKLSETVEENPQLAATLIRAWIRDDQSGGQQGAAGAMAAAMAAAAGGKGGE